MARAAILSADLIVNDKDFSAGMRRATVSVDKFDKGVVGASDRASKAFLATTVAITALGTAGLAITKGLADNAGAIHSLSEAAQTDGETFQRLSTIFTENGGTLESTAKIAQRARKALDELALGAGIGFTQFTRLGVTAEEFVGLDIDQAVLKIAKSLQGINDDNQVSRFVQDIFGSRNATAILGLLNQNIDETNERITNYTQITNKALLASRKFQDELEALNRTFKATLTNSLEQAGVLGALSDAFIAIERSLSSNGVFDDFAKGINTAIENVDGLIRAFAGLIAITSGFVITNQLRKGGSSLGLGESITASRTGFVAREAEIAGDIKSSNERIELLNKERNALLRSNNLQLKNTRTRLEASRVREESARIAKRHNTIIESEQKLQRRLTNEITKQTGEAIKSTGVLNSNIRANNNLVRIQETAIGRTRALSVAFGTFNGVVAFGTRIVVGFGLAVLRAIPAIAATSAAFYFFEEILGFVSNTVKKVVTGLSDNEKQVKTTTSANEVLIETLKNGNFILDNSADGLAKITMGQGEFGNSIKITTDAIVAQNLALAENDRLNSQGFASSISGGAAPERPVTAPNFVPLNAQEASSPYAQFANFGRAFVADARDTYETAAGRFEVAVLTLADVVKRLPIGPLSEFGGTGIDITNNADPLTQADSFNITNAEAVAAILGRTIFDKPSAAISKAANLLDDSLNVFGGSGGKIKDNLENAAESATRIAESLESERFLRIRETQNQRISDATPGRLQSEVRRTRGLLDDDLNQFGGGGSLPRLIRQSVLTQEKLAQIEQDLSNNFRRESSPDFEFEQQIQFKSDVRDQVRQGLGDLFVAGLSNNKTITEAIQNFGKQLINTLIERLSDSVFNNFADSFFAKLSLGGGLTSGVGDSNLASKSFLGVIGGLFTPAANPALEPFGGAGANVFGGASANDVARVRSPSPSVQSFGGADAGANARGSRESNVQYNTINLRPEDAEFVFDALTSNPRRAATLISATNNELAGRR